MTTLFQLASISITEKQSSPFASSSKLPDIKPRFVLPPLDDHISGTERLLGSLRGTSRYELQDLRIPPTPTKAKQPLVQLPTDTEEVDVNPVEDGAVDDIWQKAVEEPEAGHSRRKIFEPLKTWDDIASSPSTDLGNPPFLSEKSTFTFDALLTSLEPPITLPKLGKLSGTSPAAVHDSKTLLELLMRSTLGTTTTESLKWNGRKARFVWVDDGGRPIGVERVTANSMAERFLDIGSSIRRMELIIDSQSTLPLTSTHHALLHGVSTYLAFIKERLTMAVEECTKESYAGWNKWLGSTKDVRELGETLCEVMCWPLSTSEAISLPTRSSALLSHIYTHLLASFATSSPSFSSSPSTLALAFLFRQSIGPFLTILRAWIGLSDSTTQDEDTDPNSQPWVDLGITRKLTSGGYWEYTLSSRKMPSFIPKCDRRTFFEAGKNLRLLREASANTHPLCSSNWGVDVTFDWGDGCVDLTSKMKVHSKRVKKEIDHWRRSTKDLSKSLLGSTSSAKSRLSHGRSSHKERKTLTTELFVPPAPVVDSSPLPTHEMEQGVGAFETEVRELDDFWNLFDQSPGSHLNSQVQQKIGKTSQIWTSTPLDSLQEFLSRHSSESILPSDSPTLPIFISAHLLSPLLNHSMMISSSLVSLYLDDLNFLDHLDILYAYLLGGDVNFLGRVSDSLFGKDNAGAGEAMGLGRRARTRARLGLDPILNDNHHALGDGERGDWGIGLGVGLSERSKWPPGGSELAYALRTTLMDERDTRVKGGGEGGPWDEVQDRVSFAIKQLDEENKGRRAKWLDPQAIEALDFLYLSYSPPISITPLLPISLLSKYQSIHNLILRVSRCQIVLRTMYWNVLHQFETKDEPTKTGVDSGFNRPSSRNSLKKSREREMHTLFPPRSNIERKVQVLRFRMSHLVNSFGEYLDSVIGYKWGMMRRRLERLKMEEIISKGRPSSPTRSEMQDQDDSNGEYLYAAEYGVGDVKDDEDEDDEDGIIEINQLKSPHSIMVYHQITLNRILDSCLLNHENSQGQQVTFKLLMSLLKMILDLGKVLVEVFRGDLGWIDGKEMVERLEEEWEEKEKVFLHALERLSVRTRTHTNRDGREDIEEEEEGEKTEDDLQFLLSGNQDIVNTGGRVRGEADDLKELLLRLRLGYGEGQYR
ncbi:hypothetical protein V865_000934 [Kwoniella europaea PYCC6329]|uniref:Spindle pole body component n=1 Tax=Kwoniella europaea PYCC6329 TaxID=1423913 RepID=A0AAX4K8T7_9TREE